MGFKEWWEKEWKFLDFPESEDELEKIVVAAYCAGLLAAAEQDEKEADDYNNRMTWGVRAIFGESAATHRKAASEVK